MVIPASCPACGSTRYKKNGHTRHGKQNHLCKNCERQFRPTVCPSHNSARMLSYQELLTSIQWWRGHGQEAKRGETVGHRLTWHGEAIGAFLLPYAPPGYP